jgi:hypothetical protein
MFTESAHLYTICTVSAAESSEDGYIDGQDLDELYDLAADNVYEWLCCPCDRHMFFIGVAAGTVAGFTPRLVIDTAIRILRDELADDTREIPAGIDLLALNSLLETLWPADDQQGAR